MNSGLTIPGSKPDQATAWTSNSGVVGLANDEFAIQGGHFRPFGADAATTQLGKIVGHDRVGADDRTESAFHLPRDRGDFRLLMQRPGHAGRAARAVRRRSIHLPDVVTETEAEAKGKAFSTRDLTASLPAAAIFLG